MNLKFLGTKSAWRKRPKVLPFLALICFLSCTPSTDRKTKDSKESKAQVVVKKRADGTISSVNQVNELQQVHGIRVTYFGDGKTIYSKIAFNHGIKQGPSIRYYDNGQIFEQCSFEEGKKQGISLKYHKSGELLSRCEYREGHAMPGLKEYQVDGSLVTTYPEVKFREMNHLTDRNRVDLEMSCVSRVHGTKYFLLEDKPEDKQGKRSRTYLISEDGKATMQFYVKPGDTLDKKMEILAEIPTEMGNILVRELSYHLVAKN